jgi:hypothetical protein
MTRKLLSWLAAAALLAGVCLLLLDLSTGTSSSTKESGAAGDSGLQIVLRGVVLVEARRERQVYRVVSDNASYSVWSGQATASNVTLVLKEREGDVTVTAPVASWDMKEDRIDLAMGASAANGAGWTAISPKARVDLKSEVITAEEASLSGPGLAVVGNNLRWRWKEGKVELDSPRSNIHPGRDLVPGRQGGRT